MYLCFHAETNSKTLTSDHLSICRQRDSSTTYMGLKLMCGHLECLSTSCCMVKRPSHPAALKAIWNFICHCPSHAINLKALFRMISRTSFCGAWRSMKPKELPSSSLPLCITSKGLWVIIKSLDPLSSDLQTTVICRKQKCCILQIWTVGRGYPRTGLHRVPFKMHTESNTIVLQVQWLACRLSEITSQTRAKGSRINEEYQLIRPLSTPKDRLTEKREKESHWVRLLFGRSCMVTGKYCHPNSTLRSVWTSCITAV